MERTMPRDARKTNDDAGTDHEDGPERTTVSVPDGWPPILHPDDVPEIDRDTFPKPDGML